MRLSALLVAAIGSGAVAGPVLVVVDMDAAKPGIQSVVRVPPGTTEVRGVAVYVYDPDGTHKVQSIGYIGGLDRGIAFGQPAEPGVTGMTATVGSPVNPGNSGFVFPAMHPGFTGHEVQYIEGGTGAAAPIQTTPQQPIFRVDIHLARSSGVIYKFYVLDMVSAWRSGTNGAFTTGPGLSLDTGGDAVPDQTPCVYGPDADRAVPVPPAAFQVDYIDGAEGAQVWVSCYVDCNGDGQQTLNDFGCFQTRFALGDLYADCNRDGVLQLSDFGCFMTTWQMGKCWF